MVSKRKALVSTGLGLLFISLIILGPIFYPIASGEVNYYLNKYSLARRPYIDESDIKDSEKFRIVIPKIGVSSLVIPNVNPFNKKEYLEALSQGVALAKGSSLPGEEGNMFVFAHSTDSPVNITSYNAIFYLLNKLQTGDEIFLIYQGKRYRYVVTETKIVSPTQVEYLKDKSKGKTLTLMTCWPPGTTLKRLLVISKLINLD